MHVALLRRLECWQKSRSRAHSRRLGGRIARRKSRYMLISDFNIVLHGPPVDFPCSIPKTNAIKFEGLFGMHVELKAPGGGLKAQTCEKGCWASEFCC
jgi:hypothetical protein